MSTASAPPALTAEGTAAYRQQVEDAASALPPLDDATVGLLHDTAVDRVLTNGTVEAERPMSDLSPYPSTDGTLQTGRLNDTPVVELDQTLHLYEGHTPREVAFPVRMLAAAGVDTLLLTAAAGSVRPQFERGDLMLLTDHLNFQGQNPLVGPNVDDWGPRFPDMTEPYAPSLRRVTDRVARTEGVSLQKGIFMALLGPNHETAAEHRMARRLGADAVGTTVVPEVIAARHMDLSVMALTLLTEQHRPDGAPPADGTSLRTARSRLHRLLTSVVPHLPPEGTTT